MEEGGRRSFRLRLDGVGVEEEEEAAAEDNEGGRSILEGGGLEDEEADEEAWLPLPEVRPFTESSSATARKAFSSSCCRHGR